MKTMWQKAIASVFAAVAALLFIYRDAAEYTVRTWTDNGTYTHGFLIFPISIWLIWRKRKALSACTPNPCHSGIIAVILFALLWQLGHQAGAMVVEQYSVVLMIIASVWTLLGTVVFRQIAFPMFFLLFAVPFGEALIPQMMNFTANFTVAALKLTGIPVYREGTFFSLPTGNWSVVEACSGLRYFVSSLTLGTLYAYLSYRSITRRLIFIAISALTPVIANGLRAYMIVMIGHLSGMRLAVGVDHIIYGWLFFGIVMLLLFWLGSFFHDNLADQKDMPASGCNPSPQEARKFTPALLAILIPALLSPLYAAHLDEKIEAPVGITLVAPSGPWQPDPRPLSDWIPRYTGSRAGINQTYAKDGMQVSLYIGYYRGQTRGHELVTSTNQLVTSRDKEWGNLGEKEKTLDIDGRRLPVVEASLRSDALRLAVWKWYWVNGRWVVNPYMAKLLEAMSRMERGRDDSAVIMLSAPEHQKDALMAFAKDMLPGIESSLKQATHEE